MRYLLHAHKGAVDADRAAKVFKEFAALPRYEVVRAKVKHQQYVIQRA
jgi:hypothetical protein